MDNSFTALGQRLTTNEVIGSKTVACVWRFREMPKAGYFEELGAEWGADRGRNITSPGVDIKGKTSWTQEDTASFVVEWARCNSSFPEDMTHSLRRKRCSREIGQVAAHHEVDPKSQHTWRVRRTQIGQDARKLSRALRVVGCRRIYVS